MKYFLIASVLTVLAAICSPSRLAAAPIGEVIDAPPRLKSSSLMVTAYRFDKTGVGFVQLHNNSDAVVDLSGWSLRVVGYTPSDEFEVTLATFDGWLKPRGYMVVASEGMIGGADLEYVLGTDASAGLLAMPAHQIRVQPSENSEFSDMTQLIKVYAPSWERRVISSAGNYLTSFETIKPDMLIQLAGGDMYLPPEDAAGLMVVEIHPNAKSCPPNDMAVECGDYVKLYNGSTQPIQLDAYRLRSDSSGKKSSISNTFPLGGTLLPGEYTVISSRGDGDVMSLTNTGGFVWIEDTYGIVTYDSAVGYPDMSGSGMPGFSWALDGGDAAWKKMQPAPAGPNYWPPVAQVAPATVATVSTDCGPGRERNPETNRCRSVLAVSTALAPCPAGQERNPATNRCRSTTAATNVLAPCGPGQERNPETNRCRSVLAVSTALAPCPAGQERNPETNRCRKIAATSAASTIPLVQDVESATTASLTPWLITVAVATVALGYAVYEWRQEIAVVLGRFRLGRKR